MTKEEGIKLIDEIEKKAAFLREVGMCEQADKMVAEVKNKVLLALNPWDRPNTPCDKKLAELITCCPKMLELKSKVKRIAEEPDNVLIIGESGTGKEIIAHALNANKQDSRTVPINCAGLPEYLIESELFGHERGAFTGADREKKGLFEEAENGVIFLDEIGELPLGLQAKLLRVLQDGKIRRVGANYEKKINVRVVSATHWNLSELVGSGKFRLDLYARLSTIELCTIPLRDRRGDIKLIVDSLDKTKTLYERMETKYPTIWKESEFPLNVRDIQRYVRRFQLFGEI